MDTYRIFVSSPGDAQFERQRVDRVVARLNGELAGAARFVAVRWETEFYRAHETFQTQIPPATECEVVVAIFRGRLGTALPPDFQHMPDGEAYPSGTAYEVLTAIARRQQGGELPDVFVFRYPDPPLVRLDDEAKAEDARRQWEALKAFFARWFLTPDGHFKAAFQTFASTDDFEAKLERLLRDWLERKLAKGGTVTWPIATKGSPYPGLQSFGPLHAPVFFGRGRDITRAVEAWSEAGARGTPFLLVVGASGSGKSSLTRAGLVPRLTTPGVVASVDCWRVAALRPGDSPDGPLAALAHALMQGAADLPKEETGRLPALPEIAEGDYRTPGELAALLAHGDAASIKPIVGALDKVAQQEQRAQGSERSLRCDLVLLIDQLDELFSGGIDDDARRRFAAALAQLTAGGRVWIIATLRADLYELFLKDETLFRLKDQGVAYDLAPPALADMAEVVRGPARAAHLIWEKDPATNEPLDERLIRDIDRPDLLPIVQFVLDRLFQQRETRGDDVVLTNAAYHALGTLNGAIETAAEAALAPLGPPAAGALPRLLRSLVVHAAAMSTARGATPALRQAPLAALAHDDISERLVRALVDARILVSGRDQAGVAVVGLAHQRVIEAWGRAREIIAESTELLRVREDVEEARRRWDASGGRSDLLIRAGLPLSEAEHAADALGDELPAPTRAFIERSGRAARLRQRLTAAAALVFLALAVAAGFLGFVAQQQRFKAEQAAAEAERQRAQAEAARGLAEQQRQQAEFRLAAADELLASNGKVGELRQCLASTARLATRPAPPASREFFVGRWHVDQGTGTTDVDWRADGTCDTRNIFAGAQSVDVQADVCTWQFEKTAADAFVITFQSKRIGDNFPRRLPFKIINPVRIHNVEHNYDAFRIVCPAQELGTHQKDLAAKQQLAERDAGNAQRQRALSASHVEMGDVLAMQGRHGEALEQYAAGSGILARGDPNDPAWQSDLAGIYERLGLVHQSQNRNTEALEAYKSGLAIRQKLYLANRGDFATRHDLAGALERFGGLLKILKYTDHAFEAFRQELALRQGLADADRSNAQLQSELAVSLYLMGTVSEPAAAKEAMRQALAIVEALERDHKLTDAQLTWPAFLRSEIAKLP
jgi:tetratricopeptide (TPR) repeat protein